VSPSETKDLMGSPPDPSPAYAAMLAEGPEGSPGDATPARAFRVALRIFTNESRLEMDDLAAQLNVTEKFLEGWTGPREKLLADLLSFFRDIAFNQALDETTELQNLDRVLAAGRSYIGMIVTFEPLRRFFRAESPLALRLLTTRGGEVQSGVIKQITELLEFEQREHGMKLRAPADVLAYAMTRTIEGFIYNDPLADIEPDVDQAIVIIELLLE